MIKDLRMLIAQFRRYKTSITPQCVIISVFSYTPQPK